MLLKLFVIRIGALIPLCFLKERIYLKRYMGMLCGFAVICFGVAAGEVISQQGWSGIAYLILAMFPHGFFYLFSFWMLIRCIWHSWSKRVWNRIYALSIFSMILGIFAENYINYMILQIFFEILNKI